MSLVAISSLFSVSLVYRRFFKSLVAISSLFVDGFSCVVLLVLVFLTAVSQ